MALQLPITLVNNTIADADEVMANFDYLFDAITTGWLLLDETFTYSAYDSTIKQGIVTIASGGASRFKVGEKLMFTQSVDGVKYAIITAVADTSLTFYLGTDYDLDNAAITAPYKSLVRCPNGFPMDPTKWTIIVSDTTDRVKALSATTWAEVHTALQIIIGIGVWDVEYDVDAFADRTTAGTGDGGTVTLSTANNSETDQQFTSFVGYYASAVANSSDVIGGHAHRRKTLTLAAKTTYYFNAYMQNAGNFYVNAGQIYAGATVIKAMCALL